MNGLTAVAVLLGLLVVATAVGLLWRARTGRVHRKTGGGRVAAADVGLPAFGVDATLLQFSTEFCAPCRATARVLGEISSERVGVDHAEIDLTDRPDLAKRFGILQTPTTFVLDASGTIRARIGGAARADEVRATLDDLFGSPRVTPA
ncbi:TlpA family protein disulfide reductase [Leifsonia poae]|uniref:TlpA family protein disulfide reductase n=1 Tax=Leifsonia poae TaxID=110933 RepID=UPI001CBDB75F|nr:thioredoxin family protein [Leifsonia poae]